MSEQRVVPVVAALLACVLLTAVAVAALSPGTAGAATVLVRGTAVEATTPDGVTRSLGEGDEVPQGAVVRSGPDGALLRVRDRDTWLAAGTVLRVVDGARQELRDGFVMVDARRGPELALETPAGEVTTPSGAVSRVEDGRLLRVGAYAGADPVQVRAEGRRATADVARDYQVQVSDGGLPGAPTPLVLTPGDAYERALAPDLVMADEALTDLAGRLDAGEPGATVLAAVAGDVPAAVPADPPAGAPVSERSLAYLLARAVDGPVADRYAVVRGLREDGGSWGVVADLVGASVSEVAAELDLLLGGTAPALAAPPEDVDLATLLALTTPPEPAPAPAAPLAPSTPPSSPPDPVAPQDPGTGPSPAPEEPTEPVTSTVDEVVETVLDLLGGTPTGAADGSDTVVPALPSGGGLLEPLSP